MNGYELSRMFWDFSFENPDRVKPIHSAIYFFAIEHCNRLGWKEKFGLPSQMVMEAIGIKNWKTYSSGLKDLVEFGFIKMIETSKNQYSSYIIALVNFTKAHTKALDKALSKHGTKHCQSTVQSTVSIDKQLNKEQINKENIRNMDSVRDEYDLEDPELILLFYGVVRLTAFQFDKLINEFRRDSIDQKIQSLATGIHNGDKKYLKYKNHYMTLLNWLKKDGNQNSVQFNFANPVI